MLTKVFAGGGKATNDRADEAGAIVRTLRWRFATAYGGTGLKVANEFWDFLGGEGTYTTLLDIFERVGIELRPEIDAYFARYNRG